MSKVVSYIAWGFLLCMVMQVTEQRCVASGHPGPAEEQTLPQATSAAPADDEHEEPDYAFIAGGPYTQKKQSIQFIFPGQWRDGDRTSGVPFSSMPNSGRSSAPSGG